MSSKILRGGGGKCSGGFCLPDDIDDNQPTFEINSDQNSQTPTPQINSDFSSETVVEPLASTKPPIYNGELSRVLGNYAATKGLSEIAGLNTAGKEIIENKDFAKIKQNYFDNIDKMSIKTLKRLCDVMYSKLTTGQRISKLIKIHPLLQTFGFQFNLDPDSSYIAKWFAYCWETGIYFGVYDRIKISPSGLYVLLKDKLNEDGVEFDDTLENERIYYATIYKVLTDQINTIGGKRRRNQKTKRRKGKTKKTKRSRRRSAKRV